MTLLDKVKAVGGVVHDYHALCKGLSKKAKSVMFA